LRPLWIRSDSDLRFELGLLEHLAAAGLGVIRPYERIVGDRLGRLMAPEGERCFALFTTRLARPCTKAR
jgi:Ser/Thr protein kinase RdoA (MazF antagonist)